MSRHTRFFLTILYALAAVQVGLAFEFWGSFNGSLFSKLVFQGVGVGLAITELVILIVATEAAMRGEPHKSKALRGVFFALLFLNWVADIGAIATHMDHDNKARLAEVVQYKAVQDSGKEAEARINQLRADLQSRNLDRPEAALQAELVTAEDLLEKAQAAGRSTTAREKRVGELKSAIATVQEINKLEAARATAQKTTMETGVSPDTIHPQFIALQKYLSWIGIQAEPQNIQLFMGFLMATVMRAVLAIGFWAATPQDAAASNQNDGSTKRGFFSRFFGGSDSAKPAAGAGPVGRGPSNPPKRGPWTPRVINGGRAYEKPRTAFKHEFTSARLQEMRGKGPFAPQSPPKSPEKHQGQSAGRPKLHDPACPLCEKPVKRKLDNDAFLAELDRLDEDYGDKPFH